MVGLIDMICDSVGLGVGRIEMYSGLLAESCATLRSSLAPPRNRTDLTSGTNVRSYRIGK